MGGRLARRVAAVGVLALLLVWLAAARGIGLSLVVPVVLRRAAPPGGTVTVEDVRGSWLSHVTLLGLQVEAPGKRARADSIDVQYRLRGLMRRVVELPSVRVADAELDLALPSPDEAEDESGRLLRPGAFLTGPVLGKWTIVVRSAAFERIDVRIERDDGPWALNGIRFEGHTMLGPDGVDLTVDTLDAEVVADGGMGRLALAGRLEGPVLDLGTFSFVTPRSDVGGEGIIALGSEAGPVDSVGLRLRAHPLDLRDLPLELPEQLADQPLVDADVSATGPADSVVVRMSTSGPADLEARVEGVVTGLQAGLERAGATFSADVSGADLSGWTPPPLDGIVRASVEGTIEGLSADGAVRLSGTVVHEGHATSEIAVAAGELRAVFRLSRAPGPDPGGAPLRGLDASVELAHRPPSVGENAPWRSLGTAQARADGPDVRWTVDLKLDSATVRGRGSARTASEATPATIVVDSLAVRSVDLSGIMTGLPSTSISGRARGRLADTPGGVAGSVRVALGPTRIAETMVDTASLDARIEADSVDGRLRVRLPGRRLDAEMRALLDDSVVRARLPAIRYVQQAEPDSAPTVDVLAHGSGSWATGAARRRGALRLAFDSASAGSARLSGELGAELDEDRTTGDADLAVLGIGPSPVHVVGRWDLTGTSPDSMTGSAVVHATRARERDGAVDTLVATIHATGTGALELDARVAPAEGGTLLATGSADLAGEDTRAFSFTAGGAFPTASALLGGSTIDTIDIDADGAQGPQGWSRLRTSVVLRGGAWRAVVVDTARLELSLDSTGLVVDTVRVDANVFGVAGSGTLPAAGTNTGTIHAVATIRDLEPVRQAMELDALAADEGELRLTASGTVDSVAIEGSARLRALVTDALTLSGLDVSGTALLRPPFEELGGVRDGGLDVSVDRLAVGEREVRSVVVTASGGPDSVRIETSATVDERRRGTMGVLLEPRPERRAATIEALGMQLDRDEWELAGPAVLSYRDGWELRSFLIEAGQQQIRIDGGITAAGSLDVTVQVDSTDVGTVSDLAGLPGLQGWIGGTVDVRGTTANPEGAFELEGAFHRTGGRPAPMRASLRSDGQTLQADVLLEGPGAAGGRLRVEGSVPLPNAGGTMDLTATADTLDLAWALPFIDRDQLVGLGGRLDGALTLSGSKDEPVLGGSLRVRNARAEMPSLGVRWERIGGVVRGDGAALRIDSLRVRSGSGTLRMTGDVTVAEGVPLALDVLLSQFEAIHDDRYWATTSGELQIGGTLTAPDVDGRLRVESLDVFLDAQSGTELERVELTEADLEMLRDRFGYIPEAQAEEDPVGERLTADLVVELGRDSWLRKSVSPEMAVAFTGDLQVALRPGEPPNVQGSVETIANRGFVEQFGRRFRLRDGTVTFDGPPTAARLDLAAEYRIPSHDNPNAAEATIVLDIEGTRDSLSLTLSSEPEMENADIVSYIATGRPASGTLAFEGGGGGAESGIVGAGAGIAIGQLVGAVEGAAERSVGLDVVEIRREGLRQATLVAGKYLSPRIYVGFAKPVTLQEGEGHALGEESESEIEVELEALRWLLVNIEGSSSAVRFFLRGRFAY